ncbi:MULTISPECIES: Cof-type HAD-IIB family hydrolase [Aeribacillus]|uniref:Phosphatase n=1 Tax=Aeribacillus pallidus TaxID=33936 RepID=A0A223E5N5_9BACI|nr:Cof-type HAD-IIB family hydrolase [Aeribacillus pallidus]ASS90510.1 phosphatase [Aeribacillus pallidus]
MAKKHLIALDLDGTLLKDDKTISPFTKNVLQKAQEEGHIICISTGRPFRSSKMYYEELNLKTPIVNFNGAFVHHPLDESWGFHHTTLDVSVVKEIVEIAEQHQVHNILAEVLDHVYFHYHNEQWLDIFSIGNPKIEIGNLKAVLNRNVTSMLIHSDEENVKRIRHYLNEVHAEVVDHRSWAHPWHVIEIIRAGINKAVGLQKIAEFYNIPREQIIAFGDEDNDLEMIEYAGLGVAMGNGIEPLKEIADEITLTNEEDGVAKFLKELLSL